jgi:hypothetical protein
MMTMAADAFVHEEAPTIDECHQLLSERTSEALLE